MAIRRKRAPAYLRRKKRQYRWNRKRRIRAYANKFKIASLERPAYSTKIAEDTQYNLLWSNSSVQEEQINKVFRLFECKNYAQYTQIFDQYRINGVLVEFIPVMTQQVIRPYDDTTTANLVNKIPEYSVAIDLDDGSPQSFEGIIARRGAKTQLATKRCSIFFKPATLMKNINIGNMIDQSKRTWDCGSSDVIHYGIKGAMEVSSPSTAYTIKVRTTYYVSFFNKRH